MKRLIFLCTALIALVNCKRLPNLGIVGGAPTKISNYPYQASIIHIEDHICGASILDETTLLTASHCLQEKFARHLKVRVGSDLRDDGGEVYGVKDFAVHPGFSFSNFYDDVAVLWLDRKLTFSKYVKPIPLPATDEKLPVGVPAVVTGWGRMGEDADASEVLRYVQVPVWEHSKCVSAYKPGEITDKMLCAGVPQGGKDACQRDSGGPLVARNKLIGVVSWGEGCGRPGTPGVYANVAALKAWIDEMRKRGPQ